MAETLDSLLRNTLNNVNDWLKFAEAKNGALLAANLAAMFGVTSKDFQDTYLEHLCSFYSVAPIVLLLISFLICLISFAPKIAIPAASKEEKSTEGANLIFYGDIARFETFPYLKALTKASGLQTQEFNKVDASYAAQIIINSRIALKKYYCFNWALLFTMAAIIIPAIGFIILFLQYLK